MPIPLHRLDMRVEGGMAGSEELNLLRDLELPAGRNSKPYRAELNPNLAHNWRIIR
jgi:hypothetical protein